MGHILNTGRNFNIYLIDNVIYQHSLLNIVAVGKVYMNVDFQKNKILLLFYGAVQFIGGG